MEEKRSSTVWLAAVALIVLPLTAYVGSYLLAVQSILEIRPNAGGNVLTAAPHYGSWHSTPVVAVFSPMHQIDRIIRSDMWGPKQAPALLMPAPTPAGSAKKVNVVPKP